MSVHDDALRTLGGWSAPDPQQEALRRQYVAHLRAHDDATWRSCSPDHLTASAVVFDATYEHVLLTLHTKAGLWLQTGGHCEPGDATVAAAALREGTEESGIDGLLVDPVPVRLDRHEVPFCGPVQPAHHLDVQLVAVAPAGAQPVRSDESDDLRWFALDALPSTTGADRTDGSVLRLIAAGARRLRESPSPAPPAGTR